MLYDNVAYVCVCGSVYYLWAIIGLDLFTYIYTNRRAQHADGINVYMHHNGEMDFVCLL